MKYIHNDNKTIRVINQHAKIVRIHPVRLRAYAAILITSASIAVAFATPFDFNDLLKEAYAPTVKKAEAQVIATPTAIPTPDPKQEIRDYIKEVFGKDADKAFKVLACENKSLNTEAVNTAGNYPAGSRDIGIFQINEYWQDVNAKFLFDWKTNVIIAHQIFRESDNSFKMWTCGRKVGV